MDRTWGVLLVLALTCAATAARGEDDAQRLVLERLNHYRQLAGAPPLNANPRLHAAAQTHAQYMADTGQLSHVQTQRTSPHFSADTLEQRLRKAGATFARSGEAVGMASAAAPATVVDDLITTVYHRLLLLSPGFVEAGAGVARREQELDAVYVAIDLAGAAEAGAGSSVVAYPADRQDAVPRDFDPASETPNPMPPQELVGQPVTVQAGGSSPLVVDRFTLTAVRGAPVEAKLLTHANDMELPEWGAALVPLQPLAPGTVYQAEFSGSVAGAPVQRRWQFTTAASGSAIMSFAHAIVPAGGRQTVRLRNLDNTRGGYVLCYEPAELIRGSTQVTFTQFELQVNRCTQGAQCVVGVRAAYDEGCQHPFARGSFRVGG